MLQEKNPQFCQIAMKHYKNNYIMGGCSAFQKKRFFAIYVLSKMGSLRGGIKRAATNFKLPDLNIRIYARSIKGVLR